jgi:hypothetical protein
MKLRVWVVGDRGSVPSCWRDALVDRHNTVAKSRVGELVRFWSGGVVNRDSARPKRPRAPDLIWPIALLAVVMLGTGTLPRAGIAAADPLDQKIEFNIPSQPLTDALYAFTSVTGLEALAAGELLSDRRSAEIRGSFTAGEALQALLAGSGLVARFVDSGSFTLAPVREAVASAPASETPSDIPRYAQYSTLVQKAVKRALCRQTETRPGDYRTAVQLWIAPSGAVSRAALVHTTGDIARDQALSTLLGTLSIGAPPPGDLPQPATLLILPRSRMTDCAAMDRAGTP